MFRSNLLNKHLNIKLIESKKFIFDQVRKKKVIMTPEEWVRQSVIYYLVNSLNYPLGLISVESSLNYNGLKKRSDIIVKTRDGLNNYLLVECKSFKIKLNDTHLSQVSMYNKKYSSRYVMITNGIDHLVFSIKNKLDILGDIPRYKDLD
ncbi:MAG: restriction endonuclease subunit R [Flammeovirgaceae bacterium]|nr:restriction endonuclease subunit R [Flammeovirgaceae bacterium]